MPERRADAGGGGEHGRDAGHDRHVDVAPRRLAGLDRLEDRARHGEHAWIARGYDGDRFPRSGKLERLLRAGELFAIVGGVPLLAGALRDTGKIRAVADEVGGGSKRPGGERRGQLRRAGTEADNGEATGHNGFLSPGTSTTAKYAAWSSGLSASLTMRSSGMVPRST